MSAYTVQIDVLPHYVADQSNPLQDVFAFAYTVTVTNTGRVPVQLISRHWVIQDERGHSEEIKGYVLVNLFNTPAAADCVQPVAPCTAATFLSPKTATVSMRPLALSCSTPPTPSPAVAHCIESAGGLALG